MQLNQPSADPALNYLWPIATNPRKTSVKTTLLDSYQVSQAQTDYSDCYSYSIYSGYGAFPFGVNTFTWCRQIPTETREYDFGSGSPGSLIRKTDYTYLHNSNSAYLTAHIWNRVLTKTVYDGSGTQFALTTYAYDTTTITSTSSVPNHDYTNFSTSNTVRGNPTVISRWLNITSSNLTTTNYYNDVGNLIESTDPRSNSTYYSYTDNYTDGTNRNSQAFLTSVTYPTTNSVSHVEGKQYYWNTGLTAAVCGQNAPSPGSCVNTYSPVTADYAKYTYDGLGRPYTVTHGDGGTTTFSFTEPSSPTTSTPIEVSSSSTIDGSYNLTNTVVIDGLGRVIQTQLTSDPDGTDYVDTAYDAIGRVSTVSNPHRSSSSPTDGTTTSYYDGLGRTTQMVPPDGTTSANNASTVYFGNMTTVTDEAGKVRRSYTDALGRLARVDEPAYGTFTGTAATPGTGSVTIGGSEQSVSNYVDTGTQQCTLYDCGGNCIQWQEIYQWVTTYDSGTVSITANGHTDTVSYGSSSSTSSIASALAAAINADSSAYVTASASGSVVNLTTIATGSSTGYSLATSVTYDTSDFSGPSFTAGPSGSNLLHGFDAIAGTGTGITINTPLTTLYFYDPLNNLTCVEQHGTATGQTGCSSSPSYDSSSAWRVRRFTYDSLSRLVASTNPESGAICYGTISGGTCQKNGYDANGNLIYRTDARGILITYTYDALNRLTQKTYSDSTPTVTIAYDGTTISGCSPTLTITDGIDRRTAMCDGAGWESWAYDSRGHVLTDRRNTNSVTKDTTYAYNYAGGTTSITYPLGRTITYTFNAANQGTSASDVANSITYASNAHYAPPGELSSLQNSGSAIISTAYYNNRLQPCRISVKSSGTPPSSCTDSTDVGNVLDYTYAFNSGTANNGNVASISNNITTARGQSFTYDELNRVSTAQTVATSGTYSWGLSFGYDAWANLLTASVTQGSAFTLSLTATGKNQLSGYTYDAAGNLTSDGTNSYTYDAENHLLTAGGVTYTYDGDGDRVKKSSGKLYWFGTGTDALDETDASGNLTDEYMFFGGSRIARRDSSSNVVYFFADHIGSARVITNASGTIQDDSDFYPFGGERPYISSSGNTYKFTGKERDSESGLDNFTARFYASTTGRFMSADDSKYVTAADPQTWNLYGYVANNPLNAVDPTGHDPEVAGNYRYLQEAMGDGGPGAEFGEGGTRPGSGDTNSGTGSSNLNPMISCLMCLYDGAPPSTSGADVANTVVNDAGPDAGNDGDSCSGPCDGNGQQKSANQRWQESQQVTDADLNNALQHGMAMANSGVNAALTVEGAMAAVVGVVAVAPVAAVYGTVSEGVSFVADALTTGSRALGATIETTVPGGMAAANQLPDFVRGFRAGNSTSYSPPQNAAGWLGWAVGATYQLVKKW
jgi:RHS repeat-associated protein